MSLKILWATPLDRRSAIGRMSRDVCESLAQTGHDVVIARTETIAHAAAPTHATTLPVTSARVMVDPAAREGFDAVILNIGNHHAFHAGVFPLLGADRSVGVFHDFYLVDLLMGELVSAGLGGRAIEAAISDAYRGRHGNGELPPTSLSRIIREGRDIAAVASQAPMVEWFAARVDAAVAHAGHYHERIAAACPGPTRVIPLAYAPPGIADLPLLPQGGQDETVRVLTIGWMGLNKCCAQVIEAIGALADLRARARYRLAGPIRPSERGRLETLAAGLGVGLDVLGEVDDATLLAELDAADMVCCLRRPILEGASASAIEAMLAARPVVVCDAGFYGELPDDAAVKVPADVPVAALSAALARLAADPGLRRRIGARARRHAAIHAPSRYAAAIAAMVAGLGSGSLATAALRRRVGTLLAELGIEASDPLGNQIMTRVATLGASKPRSMHPFSS